MLGQEGDAAVTDTQAVGREIDASLVALQHIKAEQEVNGLALQHRESDRKEQVAELHLRRVHTPKDLSRANAMSDAREPLVDETHDAAGLGTLWRDWWSAMQPS